MIVEYGVTFGEELLNQSEISKIKSKLTRGLISKSDRKITLSFDSDGNSKKVDVFKDDLTNEEYVFLKMENDHVVNNENSISGQTRIIKLKPLRWVVDKKSGIAISCSPIFMANGFGTDYDNSPLKKFLDSDELLEELNIKDKIKQETKRKYNNPFKFNEKVNMTLEDKIKRILLGGTRIPYLVGHPGIGKTQIAKSINKNYLAFNMATFTPDAFSGKTSIVPGKKTIVKDGETTYETNEPGKTALSEPDWHVKVMKMSKESLEKNERCILLLDEFDKLTPNMQVFINGIVDVPRTIAGWEIPDNVDIVLAGNTTEYSDAAFSISGEVASRLTKIEVEPNTIDWLRWANSHDVDPVVKAYLHIYPEKIIVDAKDKDGNYDPSISLTPRSWDQKISEEIKVVRKLGDQESKHLYLEPYMEKEIRKDFEKFIEFYFSYGVEEILKGNIPTEEEMVRLGSDKVQMIINCLVATAVSEDEIYNVLKFIKYSTDNFHEYLQLFEMPWIKINNSPESILSLRLAKESLENERGIKYGR